MIRIRSEDRYSPLHFLAALGAGGAAVTFYVQLMFLVEHPDAPVVTIDHVWPILREGNPLAGLLAGLALLAMLGFAAIHVRLLVWNLLQWLRCRHTAAWRALLDSHAATGLMAIPLTLAMTVNVTFLTAMVLVPGLWRDIEALFPFALLALFSIGVYALYRYAHIIVHLVRTDRFAALTSHSLNHMTAVFAFAMVAMGLAAPGCMSEQAYSSAIGRYGSLTFAGIALSLGILHLAFALRALLAGRVGVVASPGLWVAIPVLTLLGIVAIRNRLGPLQGFDDALLQDDLLVLTGIVLIVQLAFGALGYRVMQRLGYFRDYLHGEQRHPGSYALICPGIALFVFGMYFISYGLVKTGVVEAFSAVHISLLATLTLLQWKTLATLFRLNSRLLGSPLAA
ncbi:MAG: hypothetical protein KDJ33_16610 [Gammaproteobacteria bacterium]|nr:hypothetical protein [Gammaproteobacteria bacterium]